MKFLMTTIRAKHWNELEEQPYYENAFVAPEILERVHQNKETETIFTKIEGGNVQRAWYGITKNFSEEGVKIYFDVELKSEIQVPSYVKKWISTKWRRFDFDPSTFIKIDGTLPPPPLQDRLIPNFFSEMNSNSWDKFEDDTYSLLRIIGIHNIHKYPRTEQQGKPDGFFVLKKTAIIYDATINNDFQRIKETQIDPNFTSQLQRNRISFGNKHYDITSSNKYVWIITRNSDTRSNLRSNDKTITRDDDIVIKEIPFKSLIEIYNERLQNSDMTEKDFETKLQEL